MGAWWCTYAARIGSSGCPPEERGVTQYNEHDARPYGKYRGGSATVPELDVES